MTVHPTITPNKKKFKFDLLSTVFAVLLSLFTLIVLLPMLNVFSEAISDGAYVISGRVSFWPIKPQLDTIKYVLGRVEFTNSFGVTLFTTLVGTCLSMFLTVTAAYPLSKPALKGRKPLLYLYVVVMLFNAGTVPTYIMFNALGLLNNIWALVLSGTFSVSNMFIVKNYMESLPEAVEEAAVLDGASNLIILLKIVLPMSMPVLATMILFYAVGYWNNYMAGVLYIRKASLKPLQQYMMDLINATSEQITDQKSMDLAEQVANIGGRSMQSATLVLSVVPIMCVYPFLQKYFIKGITIGSVKG